MWRVYANEDAKVGICKLYNEHIGNRIDCYRFSIIDQYKLDKNHSELIKEDPECYNLYLFKYIDIAKDLEDYTNPNLGEFLRSFKTQKEAKKYVKWYMRVVKSNEEETVEGEDQGILQEA